MKALKRILLVLVIVIVVVIVSVPLWIDSAAASAVEAGAGDALGVPTTLGGIDIGIFGGECSLEGLNVSNPEGYKEASFLRLDNGYVSVSLGSLMEDKVVVPELTLDGLELNLERQTLASNYGKILDHIKKRESAPKAETEGKKFVIEKVTIRNVEVTTRFSLAGIPRPPIKLNIPEVTFENLGSDSGGGVVLSTVMSELLKATLVAVMDAGKGVLPDDITKGLGAGLEGLKGVGGFGLKIVGEGGKVIGDVAKGIGGLFGGKKKD